MKSNLGAGSLLGLGGDAESNFLLFFCSLFSLCFEYKCNAWRYSSHFVTTKPWAKIGQIGKYKKSGLLVL